MKKKIIPILLIIFCLITLCGSAYAVIDTSQGNINTSIGGQFDTIGQTMVARIRVVGVIISVIALMILGLRYMFMSVEERAEEKQLMIYYCIGAILVFAIVNIVTVIYELFS